VALPESTEPRRGEQPARHSRRRREQGQSVTAGDDRDRRPLAVGVTGALGYIGSSFTQSLLDRGWRVRTFTRRGWDGPPWAPIEDRRILQLPAMPEPADLDGLDALVHLAVAAHGSSEATADAVNCVATRRLYEAAVAAGVPRFVFVSTQSAHDGARNRYGRTKRAAERAVEGRPGAVVVRPGLVYDGGPAGLLGLASGAAARLRVFPVVGGAASVAQPIHLDDLNEALARLVTMAEPPSLVELAEPELYGLGDLVADAAHARLGVRPRTLDVPMSLVRRLASVAERVGVGEPVAEVVRGIEGFRPMDTGPQLDAIGVALRPFDPSPPAERPAPPDAPRPRRLVLVGAGRIGMVHGLVGMHHPDAVLSGIVDPQRGAAARLRALLGQPIPWFRSVDEALVDGPPDAAVVATPPATHVVLAERLLSAGIDVLVEKPVAPRAEDRRRLHVVAAAAQSGRPPATVSGGYHLVQLPHVRRARELLHSGAFGQVRSFCALGFVARADGRSAALSWELDPERAGGGALPQVAAHCLSLLDALVGPLEVDDATLVQREDRRVEDAAWVRLHSREGASGSVFAGWHLPDFVIPENSVRLGTDRGTLVVSMASAVFLPDAGDPVALHCLDTSVGFDPAPADGAAGFGLEQRAALAGAPAANGLDAVERIERISDAAYGCANRVRVPVGAYPGASVPARVPMAPAAPGVHIDLRRLGDPWWLRQVVDDPQRSWVIGVDDLTSMRSVPDHRMTVVLPDVAALFRVMTNQGPVALLRRLGPTRLARAGLGVRPAGALSDSGRLWEAFAMLLRTEAAAVPEGFCGRVAVDGYLVDMAAATGRLDDVARLVDDLRRRLPRAVIGIETNAPVLAASVVPVVREQLGFVLALGRPGGGPGVAMRAAAERDDLLVLAKTGPQPPEVVAAAASDPGGWLDPGDELVADWRGVAPFAERYAEVLSRAMRTTGCPSWAVEESVRLLGLSDDRLLADR
jgi:predicted dehydrogenase/nucleoside-diphosphate-sugar epimerase